MRLDLPTTNFEHAVIKILEYIDNNIIPENFNSNIDAFIVGGAAVHIYTKYRVSTDLDAVFSHKLLIPKSPVVFFDNNGSRQALRLDTNYTEVLALMHPDWRSDSIFANKVGRIIAKVISPVDLAVSKVSRFADNDKEDIKQLSINSLIDYSFFEKRCKESLEYYVGSPSFINYNINDAVNIIKNNTLQNIGSHQLKP